MLFRNVRISQPQAAYGFLEATGPLGKYDAKQKLRESVRTLEVTIMSKKMVDVLPFVLRHCPKLHEFAIKIHTKSDLNIVLHPQSIPLELKFLSSVPYGDVPLPRIQALRVNSDNNKSLYKILRTWPDIRHLVLFGEALVEFCFTPHASATELEPNGLRLYEFQSGRLTARGKAFAPQTALTVRTSLASSIGTLQILDLNGISPMVIRNSGLLFIEHGPHLKSLRLPFIPDRINLPFLRYCVSLEEVIVYGFPPVAVCRDIPVDTIVHASFTTLATQAQIRIQPALNWLATFPKLVVLSWCLRRVPVSTNSDKDQALLHRFCQKKGVRYRTSSMFEVEVCSSSIFSIGTNPVI